MKQTWLSLSVALAVSSGVPASLGSEFEFNTDLLDTQEKAAIARGAFKRAGYVVPGRYNPTVVVNGVQLGQRQVRFYERSTNVSELCVTASLAQEFALARSHLDRLLAAPIHTLDEEVCHDPAVLDGIVIQAQLNKDTLTIGIPQAYRDYANEYWDPPSRWDDGVTGALFDYGINVQQTRADKRDSTSLTGYGVAGINTGKWRWRADWQASYQRRSGADSQRDAEVRRVYGYRVLADEGLKLTVGEQDMGGALFDSFAFTGATLITDDNMLPPNLRGYAPEVVGVAQTNAKVVISQSGRVVYESQVAAGPFRIQDLSSTVVGVLDVRVEEQDGTVQTYQVNTANIPYLSRPGAVRYKLNSGKVSSQPRETDGPLFASGEFSWGVSNGWSMLGGALLSQDYTVVSLGVGRDLMALGAISFDITESHARLPEGVKQGGSYRVNYSKQFEQYDSQVTFAGYRFSDRDFMNMSDFMAAKQISSPYRGGAKEMYSIVASKQFTSLGFSSYVDYSHQSYWHQEGRGRISAALSRSFSLPDHGNVFASLSGYRSQQGSKRDTGLFLSFSLPFGTSRHVNYSTSRANGQLYHSLGISERLDERGSYTLNGTSSPSGQSLSGFYSHTGDVSSMTASVTHSPGQSTSAGLSLNSGVTVTAEGAAIHRVGAMGGTRIMVDTDGARDVPVHSGNLPSFTNRHGVAVVTDVSNYYRQRTTIDVDKLGDDAEPIGAPIMMGSLTEGAIGYRHFDMLSGSKRMVVLMHPDGAPLPFAAEVLNEKQQPIGMIGDDGMAYLAGLNEHGTVSVRLDEGMLCHAALPSPLPAPDETVMLTCR